MRSRRARASRAGRRLIPRCWWPCGFTRQSREWVRRGSWSGWRNAIWPTGGSPGVRDVRVLAQLLSESVTALIAEGMVSLAEIALDVTKVRAHASRESFKTGGKLVRIGAAGEERGTGLKG